MELLEKYGLGSSNLALNSFVASQHPSESVSLQQIFFQLLQVTTAKAYLELMYI